LAIRIISIIANTIALIWMVAMFWSKGMPNHDEFPLVAILLFAQVSALAAAFRWQPSVASRLADAWPFIVIKRLTLEERRRLDSLSTSKD
jgi:hypothetical protein